MITYKELATVEGELGIPLKTLYSVSNNVNAHYRRVLIPKKDGTYRNLSVPDAPLKRIQRAINEKLLVYEPISRYATAYRIASGIRNNALPHIGMPKVLKLDIKGFFDSVTYSLVKERVFRKEKYSEPVRVLLTILCYYKDVLPQGAPTSPVITNIVMREFDEVIGEWCGKKGIAYTRYCDDMTFSGDFDEKEVKAFVAGELKKQGFFLNAQKTVVATAAKRQTVTGVVVNKKANVSSEYRREIRKEVFFCQKYGVAEHIERLGLDVDTKNYLRKLLGRINYVLQISPDDGVFQGYKNAVTEMLANER
ncbi:MAG: RNA-directed DNA polymerase [Clostridia bacterium]|nr:RNA-directed DNA polymerase [Clostridia bacterium]